MNLLLLESTGSTQDELISRLGAGSDLDAVAAGMQTSGRGRFGRQWISPAGESLSLSVAIPMPIVGDAAPYIGMALAARVAERYDVAVQWPNDVTSGRRKIAGILIEGVQINGVRRLIVGIGVNLTQTGFPEEIAERATSLKLVKNFEPDWRDEAAALTRLCLLPAPPDFPSLAPLWSRRDETRGKAYKKANGEIGIARGVDPEGHLLLEGEAIGISVAEAYFGRPDPCG